jgi:hypothetical protein
MRIPKNIAVITTGAVIIAMTNHGVVLGTDGSSTSSSRVSQISQGDQSQSNLLPMSAKFKDTLIAINCQLKGITNFGYLGTTPQLNGLMNIIDQIINLNPVEIDLFLSTMILLPRLLDKIRTVQGTLQAHPSTVNSQLKKVLTTADCYFKDVWNTQYGNHLSVQKGRFLQSMLSDLKEFCDQLQDSSSLKTQLNGLITIARKIYNGTFITHVSLINLALEVQKILSNPSTAMSSKLKGNLETMRAQLVDNINKLEAYPQNVFIMSDILNMDINRMRIQISRIQQQFNFLNEKLGAMERRVGAIEGRGRMDGGESTRMAREEDDNGDDAPMSLRKRKRTDDSDDK